VARDKEEWLRLIGNAKPVVTHVMETLASGRDINDPRVKNQIAMQVVPLIEDLPNALERETYRQQLSRLLRVDERALVSTQVQAPGLKRVRPRGAGKGESGAPAIVAAVSPTLRIETYCLGVLFRKPELLYRLDRKLQEFGLSPLAMNDFEYTDHQLLFRTIRQAVEQDEKDHHLYVINHLPESLEGLSKDLLAQTGKLDPVDEKLLEELLARFIDLRRMVAQASVSQLRFLQEEEQGQGGMNLKQYQSQAVQFTRLLQSLDQAKRQLSMKRQA
jgi:DNA primase